MAKQVAAPACRSTASDGCRRSMSPRWPADGSRPRDQSRQGHRLARSPWCLTSHSTSDAFLAGLRCLSLKQPDILGRCALPRGALAQSRCDARRPPRAARSRAAGRQVGASPARGGSRNTDANTRTEEAKTLRSPRAAFSWRHRPDDEHPRAASPRAIDRQRLVTAWRPRRIAAA
jgi:hypothetical protein